MVSGVIAGAPGACCIKTSIHMRTAAGRVEKIGGLDTYISEPPTQVGRRKVLLSLGRLWLDVDQQPIGPRLFCILRIHCLGPDYFFGFGVVNHPPGFDTNSWIDTALKPAQDAFPAWVDAVKAAYDGEGVTYCAVGYCFGGPFVADLLTHDWLTAAAMAHPAWLEESHFRAFKKPVMISCPEFDDTMPVAARHRAEEILSEIKVKHYIQLFSGTHHGFAVRAKPEIENDRWAKEECARAMKEWFLRFTQTD